MSKLSTSNRLMTGNDIKRMNPSCLRENNPSSDPILKTYFKTCLNSMHTVNTCSLQRSCLNNKKTHHLETSNNKKRVLNNKRVINNKREINNKYNWKRKCHNQDVDILLYLKQKIWKEMSLSIKMIDNME